MWKAKYSNGNQIYWRTFYADDMAEARLLARRYTNKGYMCQQFFKVKSV